MLTPQRAYAKRKADRLRIALKRSWRSGTHRHRVQSQGLDADTLRYRSREDRRGEFYAEILKQTELGPVKFLVLWSVNGRSDQVDVFEAGKAILTVRPGKVLEEIDRVVGEGWKKVKIVVDFPTGI